MGCPTSLDMVTRTSGGSQVPTQGYRGGAEPPIQPPEPAHARGRIRPSPRSHKPLAYTAAAPAITQPVPPSQGDTNIPKINLPHLRSRKKYIKVYQCHCKQENKTNGGRISRQTRSPIAGAVIPGCVARRAVPRGADLSALGVAAVVCSELAQVELQPPSWRHKHFQKLLRNPFYPKLAAPACAQQVGRVSCCVLHPRRGSRSFVPRCLSSSLSSGRGRSRGCTPSPSSCSALGLSFHLAPSRPPFWGITMCVSSSLSC